MLLGAWCDGPNRCENVDECPLAYWFSMMSNKGLLSAECWLQIAGFQQLYSGAVQPKKRAGSPPVGSAHLMVPPCHTSCCWSLCTMLFGTSLQGVRSLSCWHELTVCRGEQGKSLSALTFSVCFRSLCIFAVPPFPFTQICTHSVCSREKR